MRRFEFSDSTSNKFWEVDVKGKTLNVTFGKIGTKGQSKPKDLATPEKAKAEMEKLIKEKTGKGYVEVGGKAVKAIKPAAKSASKSPAKPAAGRNTVTRWTRAGRDGREIVCPHCGHVGRVYHFTWSALTCNGCHRSIDKTHWLAPSPNMGEGLSKSEKRVKVAEEDLGNGVKLEMVLVPSGKFKMGSPASEKDRYKGEAQHEVTLTKPYYIGKYAVTQEQWEAVMGDNPSGRTKGAKYPVTNVSWDDCQKFIKKLNGITKGKYRLPTESEWEYACRAGTTTAYSFGAKITPKDANYDANYDANSGTGEPIEVGSYKPNALGLYDMHGNVFEWCEDWEADYPKGAVIDPKGPAKGTDRVLRGGSFEACVVAVRSSHRNHHSPSLRIFCFGLRLARTTAGSVGKALSKAEKKAKAKAKAEKVLAMFAGGQWELARGILEVAQDEHWLFEELLKKCEIEDGKPKPSGFMQKFYKKKEKNKAELVMLEVLLHLPKEVEELQKLRGELGIKLRAPMLSKYWKEVAEDKFEGVKYGDLGFLTAQWYEAREAEIAKVEKECEDRSKVLNKAWREEEDLGNGVTLEMVLVPSGKFVMGSPANEKNRGGDEAQHEVTLTKPYYMGKYAVTQEQWETVMGNNQSDYKGAKLPVTDVSWDDCQKFIKKLNGITKGKYRLPTESEWEYACRAGTRTAYSFGDEILPKDANYNDSKLGKPVAVGRYKPNDFGLYDMHGNVWEWCEDWKADYPTRAVTDPKGPATGIGRVLRGGSFYVIDAIARSSNRNHLTTYWRADHHGFRLARTAAGNMGEGLSKAEKQAKAEKEAKAEKVLLMFAGGQWELARGILEAAQDEHWLFEELLKGCKIEDGLTVPSLKIMDIFGEPEITEDDDNFDAAATQEFAVHLIKPVKSKLLMFEVLLHLPKELEELREELGIKLRVEMLSKYWKEVAEDRFRGVKYGDPGNFTDQWYEARETEIAKVEKEGEARGTILKMPWKEKEDLGKGVKLEMVLVPAGKFMMGSPASEKDRYKGETQHEVTLTKPFYMGKYEVTQEQWEAVMGNNPSETKGAKLPVTDVSWEDCQEFIKKLNAKTNGGYRLPTEAEWEYACRAGTSTAYSFGDKITPKDANYRDSENYNYNIYGELTGQSLEVGSYKPNALGLYDMHGSVWEWCEDWEADYPKGAVIDPKGSAKGTDRVMRGGSFYDDGWRARSSFRLYYEPTNPYSLGGFRLARTAL